MLLSHSKPHLCDVGMRTVSLSILSALENGDVQMHLYCMQDSLFCYKQPVWSAFRIFSAILPADEQLLAKSIDLQQWRKAHMLPADG